MPSDKIEEPAPLSCGRVPTMNRRGFTTSFPDPLSEQFIQFAAGTDAEVLDIGCAYGVAVKRVLRAGGRICACDMDLSHLKILYRSVEPVERTRLRCVAGTLPEIDLGQSAFGAILCSRVLHFLKGRDVEVSLSKMYRWLRPGGKFFLVVDTPYSGVTSRKFVPEYKRRKVLKDPWPGLMADYTKYLPAGVNVRFDTPFIHTMDPDILIRVCEQAGFTIESAGYMARIANLERADPEGRDHAIVVAVKT